LLNFLFDCDVYFESGCVLVVQYFEFFFFFFICIQFCSFELIPFIGLAVKLFFGLIFLLQLKCVLWSITIYLQRLLFLILQGDWNAVSWSKYALLVERFAKALLASDVKRGERVMLVSETRFEWAVVCLATQMIGAVLVTAYSSSSSQVTFHSEQKKKNKKKQKKKKKKKKLMFLSLFLLFGRIE
jgi:hypothetical protein